MAFEQEGDVAKKSWNRIAKVLTTSGKDPNWRRRPSVLDELRGWKRLPKKKTFESKAQAKAPK